MARDSTPEVDYHLLRQLWQSMKHRQVAVHHGSDCLPDLGYGFWHAGNTLETFTDYLSRAEVPYAKAIGAELADDGIAIFEEALGIDLRGKLPARLPEVARWHDYGWWGLAFLKVHALTGAQTYLECAEKCWLFLMSGRTYSTNDEGSLGGTWNHDPGTGGIQNVITNAVFLNLSAQLYLRVSSSNPEYRTQARAQYEWFRYWFEHGALRSVALGKLMTPIDKHAVQQSHTWSEGYWTGAQGALLGGLQAMNQLAKVAADPALGEATAMYGDAIAGAVLRGDELTRKRNGRTILYEPLWRDLNGATGKGVLVRYLTQWLHYRGQLASHAQFVRDNARAVATAPSSDEFAPMSWVGAPDEQVADADGYPRLAALTRQCSALDAHNALLLVQA